jgi:choline dehydrogenase-like flavoprotein
MGSNVQLNLQRARRYDLAELEKDDGYDAVIVGSGAAGAIVAKELSEAGKRVLVVEAAEDTDRLLEGYESYLNYFYARAAKDNQSPFPSNPNALMPRGSDLRKLAAGETNGSSYIVQSGPYVTDTVYSRAFGGTTIHWEAKTPRMLPQDFKMRELYGQGVDWPIAYECLEEDYERAEREMGVSADVADQQYLGMKFRAGYHFPMHGLPLSYLDQQVAGGIDDSDVELYGETYKLKVRPFPQARNSIPNAAYDGGKGYTPIGAVASHQADWGERCQGNTNCVPICPVQAKYHAGKTLAKAFATPRADLVSRAVASKIEIDPDNGNVRCLKIKVYKDAASPEHETRTVKGKIYVIAANAIETPRLLLASGLKSTSRLVGCNLMDHAYLLSWALMPQVCGTMRGTSCTGGIIDLRDGGLRRHQAAFSVDIHNDGWGWATGAPYSDLIDLVDNGNKFGGTLRQALIDRISHQLMLAFMIEVPPSESNRISVDPQYTDALGNMRPIVSFALPDYTMEGAAYARRFAQTVFSRLGADDRTAYDQSDYGFVSYKGDGYAIRGGNHLAGTHVMGTSQFNSVVNDAQRSWDHRNMYLVGTGSMPTIGTANVTLTMAALAFRSARAMVEHLNGSIPRSCRA